MKLSTKFSIKLFKMVDQSSNVLSLYSYKPLTFILKLFSLKYVERKTKDCVYLWFLKVTITLVFFLCYQIYCYYSYYLVFVNDSDHFNTISYIDITQSSFSYLQFMVDLYFVYKYGGYTKFEYLKCFRYINNIVGFSKNDKFDVKYSIKLYFFSLFVAWFVTSAVDLVAWVILFGITAIAFFPFYLYSLIKMLTAFDFIFQILLIECCLKSVSNFLRRHQGHYFSQNKLQIISLSKTDEETRLVGLKMLDSSFNEEILRLKNTYLLLIKQSSYVNEMYGFRILLNCSSLILDMVYLTTLAYHSIIGTLNLERGELEKVSSIMRLVNGPLVLISLVYRCEQCYRQNENIMGSLDELMAIDNIDAVSKQALGEFRNLVQTRAISFHAANFFKINYSLLVSIASTCVTYTIIVC